MYIYIYISYRRGGERLLHEGDRAWPRRAQGGSGKLDLGVDKYMNR